MCVNFLHFLSNRGSREWSADASRRFRNAASPTPLPWTTPSRQDLVTRSNDATSIRDQQVRCYQGQRSDIGTLPSVKVKKGFDPTLTCCRFCVKSCEKCSPRETRSLNACVYVHVCCNRGSSRRNVFATTSPGTPPPPRDVTTSCRRRRNQRRRQ